MPLRAFYDRDDTAEVARGGDTELAFPTVWARLGEHSFIDKVCNTIDRAASEPRPVCFASPLVTFASKDNAAAGNVAEAFTLSVECDASPKEAEQRLRKILGAPTLVVASGGLTIAGEERAHLHWRLARPTGSAEEYEALRLARELAAKVAGADGSGVPPNHPYRWAGSLHRKREPRLVDCRQITDTEIDLDEALQALRKACPAEEARPRQGAIAAAFMAAGGANGHQAETLDVASALAAIPNADLAWNQWNRIGMAAWRASSGHAFAAFDAWSQKSPKYDAQATVARWEHYPSSPPNRIGAGTLFQLAAQAVPGWRKPSASAQAAREQGERPLIRVKKGYISQAADEAESALANSTTPIFSRAGALVRPVVEAVPATQGRTTTVAKFRPLSTDETIDLLDQAAAFEGFDGRAKKWVRIDPPRPVAQILLAREGMWTHFPRVAGVITAPTLRPDGSLLIEAGYDPTTRLFLALDEHLELPEIPAKPTRAQAEVALRLLSDLIDGFAFVGPIDRAVALSGIITAVVRGAMPVAPLHAIAANTPGTGKSLLVDTASVITTGRQCPVTAAGRTEEETEKRLGALLRDGVTLVSIDNLNGELGGDALCQMVERPLVRVRILGKSEAPEFESKATIFATGNNIILRGDMVRRAMLCSLDAGTERPELRRFSFNPATQALLRRGEYIAAAIIISAAYRAAGSPVVCEPLGSFAEWSETVRAPLIWLGAADPVASMEKAREDDPELSSIRELFSNWREHLFENESYTTARIIEKACSRNSFGEFERVEFRDTLLRVAGEGGAVSSRRLGRWLSRIKGRIVNRQRLTMRVDVSHGNRFSLEEINPSSALAPPPVEQPKGAPPPLF